MADSLTDFTTGDLVISLSGDGSGTGTYTDNQAAPITLEELSLNGTTSASEVGSMMLPVTQSTGSNGATEYAISGEYGSSSEGTLELSANGASLVIAGYGINPDTYNAGEENGQNVYGNAAEAQSTSIEGGQYVAVARVVADISANGTVDTSTALYNVFDQQNPRSVATVDGTAFYLSGQGDKGSTNQGVFSATDGASSASAIYTGVDTRTAEIYNGVLYVSSDSSQAKGTGNISSYGASPTGTTTPTPLPGITGKVTLSAGEGNSINASSGTVDLSPENFFFANSTTLYVADSGNPKGGTVGDGGLQKWSLVNGTWALDYTLANGLNLVSNATADPGSGGQATTGLIGLTGVVNSNGTVSLYATNATVGDLNATYLYGVTDTLAATAASTAATESFTELAAAPADSNIRGVAFAPTAAATTPTTIVVTARNSPYDNATVTSGDTIDVQSGGVAVDTTVETGGVLEVEVGGAENNAIIQAGGKETLLGAIGSGNVVTGTATSTDDLNYGTITAGSGAVVSNLTIENGGILDIDDKSASATNVTVLQGGLLEINGNSPANNVTLAGGTLDLQSAKADTTSTTGVPSASGSLTFAAGDSSRLQIDVAQSGGNGTTFAQTITGFAQGDVIDLGYIANGVLSETTVGGNTDVTVTGTLSTGKSGSETFVFAGAAPAQLATVADGSGTDLTVTCYASGTRIRTSQGDVAVERLSVGDLVVTASGERRPICWIGHRTVDCRQASRPRDVMPVRISAHTFEAQKPERDLLVSPGHAICVDIEGGVLIPASYLVNGSTIQQIEVDQVTYWHVELDSHDILIAENLPAESYLEMGNRSFFQENSVTTLSVLPDGEGFQVSIPHDDFCRPFYIDGPLVERVRSMLRARALEMGWSIDGGDLFADLHLLVDGVRVDPVRRDLSARFLVPAGASDVWLVSRTSRPWGIGDSADGRDLGVFIRGLIIDDGFGLPREIELGDPLLNVGFYDLEGGTHRWTAGRAHLPAQLWAKEGGLADEGLFLRVDLGGPALPGWIAAQDAPLSVQMSGRK